MTYTYTYKDDIQLICKETLKTYKGTVRKIQRPNFESLVFSYSNITIPCYVSVSKRFKFVPYLSTTKFMKRVFLMKTTLFLKISNRNFFPRFFSTVYRMRCAAVGKKSAPIGEYSSTAKNRRN
jgi:hypothetical protein